MTASSGYRRILWPTDFSPLAKTALEHAVRLADDHGAELVLFHALTPPTTYAAAEIPGKLLVDIADRNRAAAKQELDQLARAIRRPNLRIHTVLAQGVAFDQILRVARKLRCDLIVIATHGRTGLAHVLMGSVAENVVRRAPCPVLTVRPSELTHPQRGEGETR